jgi:hypothetical protein
MSSLCPNTPIVVKSTISFEAKRGKIQLIDTGTLSNTSTQFNQKFGNDFIIEDTATNIPIVMEGIVHATQIFFLSDRALELKLVVQGMNEALTPPFILYPNLPSLISIQNVVEIYVSNFTGQQAVFTIAGVGINT